VSIDIGRALQQLNARLARVERSPRLSHASIDNTSVEIRDGAGGLKGLVGVQADGTAAVNIVNGAAPPQPSNPIVASVLGGVTVSWDGQFAAGAVIPLDWQRVEVHAAITPVYEPVPATLQSTIETAQGATVVVPCDTPVYVRLVARNTSGTASTPSDTIGPFGPTPVVADDILDGIVTTVKLADDAVTEAKVATGAIGADQLALGIGNLAPDPSFEGPYTAALIAARPDWTIVTPGNNSAHALHVDCTSGFTTWKNVELGRFTVLPGERHFLALDYKTSAIYNGSGVKLLFRYEDATGTITGYGVAEGLVVGGAWARATAQVQAPANTVNAFLLVEASAVTAGEVWFDNIEVRTLIAGGMVAAGTITANELAALTILAGNIAADAIAAGKIAADAVTAREIAALTITAAEMAANSITVGKLAAGAVDATALAADAITGKTITGGTITGALLQTATSGQRITLNEAGANKIIVYGSSTAIGELSATGLLVKGTNGSILWLDPNNAYPNLRLTNAAQTNSAIINVSEPVSGDANLGMNSGTFSGSGWTDVKWRTYMGADFWVAERIRDSDATTHVGGRVFLDSTHASIGYQSTVDPTQDSYLYVQQGLTQLVGTRMTITAPASSSPVLFANADTAHTGSLIWFQQNSADRFKVDKDGNTTIAGNLTVTGIGNRQTKRRTSDTTRANTTTATSDTQITFTVDANAVYVIDGYLKYSGTNDFLMGWTSPTGSLGEWQGLGNGTSAVSGTAANGTQQDISSIWGYTVRTESTDIANTRTYGGITTTPFGVQVRGLLRVGSTGGTFALQWAQGTSGATVTTLYADSYVRIEKVA
jgi:hypothetical protein